LICFKKYSLAYWIMDDSYFDSYASTQITLICKKSFSRKEYIILQSILENLNFNSLKKRIRDKIKIDIELEYSKTSMGRIISLVNSYMHKDFYI